MKSNDTAPKAAVSKCKKTNTYILRKHREYQNTYTTVFLQRNYLFLAACKESCPKTKREVCGMRPKTFKNRCMINCLNKDKKKETKTQIIIVHKGKCVSGRGNIISILNCAG